MEKKLFLLGGYDLEMITIRDILLDTGYVDITYTKDFSQENCFADKKLIWGAELKEYQEFLDFNGDIFGIELLETKDITIPTNYTRIDHHNDFSDKLSAIEQTIQLLGIEMTRFHKLVAANDSGYIPAMKKFGASPIEIENIRKADRNAQGVSDEDEQNAIQSIEKYLTLIEDIIIVDSLTPKFSAITDRLFPFAKLLITHNNHMVYYGKGTHILKEKLSSSIQQGKAYTGGGNSGFFGIPQNILSDIEIQRLKMEIINIVKNI